MTNGKILNQTEMLAICRKWKRYSFDMFQIFLCFAIVLGIAGYYIGNPRANIPLLVTLWFCLSSALFMIGVYIGINSINAEILERAK